MQIKSPILPVLRREGLVTRGGRIHRDRAKALVDAAVVELGRLDRAVISFTKSLAVELEARDINVNSVAPGWVDAEMGSEAVADAGRDRIERSIPIGRIAPSLAGV